MWSIQALVVHLLLLGSILSIYFQSTVLSGLKPLSTFRELGLEPPADRIVVFVVDGLRAQSVLKDNCSQVPDLRELFHQGLVGVSRAYAPTVTRPGHIAIFAGFNEDPAAALTNFQWNPSTFDTVFNRSRNAIGWTQDVVAKVFTHLPTGGAPLRFEVFTRSDISGRLKLDDWIFTRVRKFLSNDENVEPLRNATSVVFFVYLADMDHAGHAFTPYGERYKQKLNFTQRGIRETYELFERVFNDSRTAYLMTSDHGMNDEGHHGGGGEGEVDTPFFLWGAGVNRVAPDPGQNFTANDEGLILPLYQVEQTQLAPLMSALIGLPPPMNNMALMPQGFMNTSLLYELSAFHLNAMQLLAQAKILINRHEEGILYPLLPKFETLDSADIDQYSLTIKYKVAQGHLRDALKISRKIAKEAQRCLEYYHSYYHLPLLVATTASYLVWFYLLLVQLTRESKGDPSSARRGFVTWTSLLMFLGGLVLLELMILQLVPYLTAFYLLLPFGILILALAERPWEGGWFICQFPILHLVGIIVPGGLLILMAFHNSHIGLLYFLIVCLNNRRAFCRPSLKFLFWLVLVILLSGILLIKQNSGLDFITDLIRVYLSKSHVLYFSMVLSVIRELILCHHHAKHVWIINIAALLAAAYGIYQWNADETVFTYVYVACWSYLAYAFISIPYSGKKALKRRLQLIIFNMLTVHIMLTISMASLFVQIMVTEFVLGLELYEESNKSIDKKDENADEEMEMELDEDPQENQTERPVTSVEHLRLSYRYAALILLYFYVSFFGTGHWFFNFKFESTTSRLFFPQFQLQLIAAFILLKIFIPSIIVISSIYALVSFGRRNARSIFICLFLMNDSMSLYFCYFVNNRGSWEKVRESLDHLLVTHVFIILLLVCSWIAKVFLRKTQDDKPPSTAEAQNLDNAASQIQDSQV
ncbi:GPI ethanolamine phosphate transferase 1 [Drosophila ficusphila]|uniref:GPI ethanolamine phosphate transferase 1 n=1 Tax=Drosophila ficusphila TaxID=30025 RepID=UPI0007E88AB1|nr:GPI ethanolamine phosphate transferase 1 [Drosophila ficusphila]